MKDTIRNLLLETHAAGNLPMLEGRIKFYKKVEGFGYAIIPGHKSGDKGVRFTAENLTAVKPGVNYPKFDGPLDLERFNPMSNSLVLIHEPEAGHSGGHWTDVVCLAHHFRSAMDEIAKRPYYRVRHVKGYYKKGGQFMKDSVYIEGNLDYIESKYRRLTLNDPLAPTYENELCVVHSVWEQRTKDGAWVECKDPRSFPSNLTLILVRVWQFSGEPNTTTGRKREQVLYGHMGNLLERPTTDFQGDDFAFEIRVTSSGGPEGWTEIPNPRAKKKDAAVTAEKPAPATPAPVVPSTPVDRKRANKPGSPTPKPVAMPKSQTPKPVILTSLDDLDKALNDSCAPGAERVGK